MVLTSLMLHKISVPQVGGCFFAKPYLFKKLGGAPKKRQLVNRGFLN